MPVIIDETMEAGSSSNTSGPTRTFKEREQGLLTELAALYSKLNTVRDRRVKAEQETSRGPSSSSDAASDTADNADGSKTRKRRRVLLVTRTLPFTLVWEDAQSQWRAEFPDNVRLDGAMETYLYLHEHYDCVWIGSVHGDIEPNDQNALRDQLLDERKYCPVFLDAKREKLFYHGFCKTVLWPLFHSNPPTTEDQLSLHDDANGNVDDAISIEKMYQAYVSVNQAFADAIQSVYEEGDLVWIQGYHFTLVPQMVQALFPNTNVDIGFFLHIPFPSSELYRLLNHREEILTGMLGADLVGFQTYEYARHFQSAAVRLLGLESSHKGVECNGHFARVTICPVGIDADKYTALALSPSVNEQSHQLTQQFAGKRVLLGVDPLDVTKGLVHKLLAIEELFTTHPALSRDVVFVQIVTGTPHESPLGSQVEALVSRINSKLQDVGADGPVQYLHKDMPQDALVALYTLAHALVATPTRDGLNTVPFEYVVARDAVNKPARVVLSEFAGSAHSLSGAALVNPWNTEEVVDALLAALQDHRSDDAEDATLVPQRKRHQTMHTYVRTFTTKHWADNFIDQLCECSEENALAVSGRELSRRDMTSAYVRSSRRLLFVTYEGVLATEASIPELSYPPQELIWQLSLLTQDPRNTVVLVCSRSTAVCEQWFSGLQGRVVLAAEYGVYVKWLGANERWHCMVPNMDTSWWTHVVPLLEYYTERTPGAFIERKDASVAWHYRDCDLDHGLWQASELLVSLRELTRSLPVAVCPGNRVLEVRPQKASKAWLFERVWEFMNHATLFPDAPAVATDYFGDVVKQRLPATMRSTHSSSESLDSLAPPPVVRDRSSSSADVGNADSETSHASKQPVDFLLVIASGEDRTDEDLFAYLVPAPLDLDAYCQQLEKDQLERAATNAQKRMANGSSGLGTDSNSTTAAVAAALRRRSHQDLHAAAAAHKTDANSNLQTVDETTDKRLSPRGSFRLIGRDTNETIPAATVGDLLLAPSLAGAGSTNVGAGSTSASSSAAESDLFRVVGPATAISDDAAHMFPRTMLPTTLSTTRRDEITERSKFTPRRDFPPSAALFKAMKTKYGEHFSMQRLPSTPAAAWALVVPPTARAKLEDASSSSRPGSASMDRKPSFGVMDRTRSFGLPSGSGGGVATADDEQMRREIEALRSLDDKDHATEADATTAATAAPIATTVDVAESAYRFPVNTFVCTLGRKLSQAPYFIKNAADLYQLLQEMGLNSHIRKQRMMSMGSHHDASPAE